MIVVDILKMIKNYRGRNYGNLKCSRSPELPATLPPLLQEYVPTEKILLISQAPSRRAHFNYKLADLGNDFFKCMISKIGITPQQFQRKIYWTHFCKCYPGRAQGGDKIPNSVCARIFLRQEISEVKPNLIILMGRLTIKWLLGKNLKEAIEDTINNANWYSVNGKNVRVIATLHFSKAARGFRKEYRFEETLRLIRNIVTEKGAYLMRNVCRCGNQFNNENLVNWIYPIQKERNKIFAKCKKCGLELEAFLKPSNEGGPLRHWIDPDISPGKNGE